MDCCKQKNPVISKLNTLFQKVFNQEKPKEQFRGSSTPAGCIILVGNPNVGKSLIFNSLTGSYVTVSNYPGTTVEVSAGKVILNNREFKIIDTPGLYSLLPISEEERVTRRYLLYEKADLIVHVVDAKNIKRMLPLTLQLIESNLPVVLVLNMMDETKSIGLDIDIKKLEQRLGIPVIETSAALNQGIDKLRERILKYVDAAA